MSYQQNECLEFCGKKINKLEKIFHKIRNGQKEKKININKTVEI